MAIRTKRDVLKSIKTVTKVVGGKPYTAFEIYFGTDHATGAKLRKTKSLRSEAVACVEEFFRQVKEHGEFPMGVITIRELYDAREALDLLSNAQQSVTLAEAIRQLLATVPSNGLRPVMLGEAYRIYFESIPDIQKLHRNAVGYRVGRWVTDFGTARSCTEVSSPEVAEYLTPIKAASAKSFNNCLGYIKTFMSWCAASERRYVGANPLSDMRSAQLAYKEPQFMKADNVERLMRGICMHQEADRMVCSTVLSFFCGIRQAEIIRLEDSPGDVMLEDGIVRISMPKGWTKGIVPRVVEIPPNALNWLKTFDVHHSLTQTHCANDRVREVAAALGIAFTPNVGRHSFITYHMAAYGNAALTESAAGTSAGMRTKHYQGLASRKEGERYFAIEPMGVD